MSRFRRLYGSGPGHLLAMAFCFSIAGYAVYSLFENARPWSVLLWLAGAIVVHDFVFLPLYTGAFWLASRAGRVRDDWRRQAVLHHLVAPAAVSGLLFLAWMPLILRLSAANYRPTTGLEQDPYLWRWIGLSLGLFAVSGLVYAVRRRRRRSSRSPAAAGAGGTGDRQAPDEDVTGVSDPQA